jgi:hypothetical protein
MPVGAGRGFRPATGLESGGNLTEWFVGGRIAGREAASPAPWDLQRKIESSSR